jgi:hypothetical protein
MGHGGAQISVLAWDPQNFTPASVTFYTCIHECSVRVPAGIPAILSEGFSCALSLSLSRSLSLQALSA